MVFCKYFCSRYVILHHWEAMLCYTIYMAISRQQVRTYFFFGLWFAVTLLAVFLLRSYLVLLVSAAAFAAVCHPLFRRLRRLPALHSGTAAFLVTILVVICIGLPLIAIVVLLGRDIANAYGKLNELTLASGGLMSGVSTLHLSAFAERIFRIVMMYVVDANIGQGVLSFAAQHVVGVFSNITQLFFNIVFFLIAFYYLLKDGEELQRRVFSISPLADLTDAKITHHLSEAVTGVVRGTLIVMFAQGVVAAVGFWLFGIGSPVLLGSLVFFSSFIPMVGVALVVVPVIAYAFAQGPLPLAIGLTIWSIITHNAVDNLLKPKLVERHINIHPLIILLSIIGGIETFGFLGFLIGPLVFSAAWALADIYKEEFQDASEGSVSVS